jgi:hypothetical protein
MNPDPKRPDDPAKQPTPPPAQEPTEGYSPEEEEEVQKRLEDLGYI